jgi:uncharacterized protein YaaW (UPF0174 family)
LKSLKIEKKGITEMANHITSDRDLINVVSSASEDDLGVLADFITDNGNGRISLDSKVCIQLDTFKRNGMLQRNSDLIVKEIQEFGGNSIANLFRGNGVPYREIVEDVADHMNLSFEKAESIEHLETKILLAVAVKSMEKMSPDEQQDFMRNVSGAKFSGIGPGSVAALQAAVLAGGFGSYVLAVTVANAVAKQLVGRGLAIAGNVALTRSLAVFAGPIGWAITAVWTAFDLASPAYRVTVPCVIQVAYMRQKAKGDHMPRCKACDEPLFADQKFCSKCGSKVG